MSGENYIMRSLMICTAHQCYSCDQNEKNEMGGACSTCEGEVQTVFWWGILRERDHLEDPGADGRVIFRWIFRKWDVGA